MAIPKRNYRGKSSEHRRAERRAQFIKTACGVFSEVGFHSATVKQLCVAAELTERYFYESFKTREDLFAACYDLKLDALLQNIVAALLSSADKSAQHLARTGLQAYFSQLRDDREMAALLLIEIYGVRYDQQRLFNRSIGRFSQLVEQVAKGQGISLHSEQYDADLLSAGLVGVCIQMAQRWAIDGYLHPPERLVDNCMLIFEGLESKLAKLAGLAEK